MPNTNDWAAKLANEFTSRNNSTTPLWTIGTVTSPSRDDNGNVSGALVVSVYDGQIMLYDRDFLGGVDTLEAGDEAYIVGDPFGGSSVLLAGSKYNSETPICDTGSVLSPVWDDDSETWVGEFLLSVYDGMLILHSNNCLGSTSGLHEGMTVNFVGRPFGGHKILLVR